MAAAGTAMWLMSSNVIWHWVIDRVRTRICRNAPSGRFGYPPYRVTNFSRRDVCMSVSKKLEFNKTTIRTLTDNEVNSVSGGTVDYFVLSSMPCAVAIAQALYPTIFG
ncbi:class I lanthipeptide [Massilia pinisoli]|uniref:class I lanthipeptide n=2 Tax=Massilia pinisoli TaxID=1772194 RepID=UPI00363B5CE7